jgi:hypothetical protein
MMDLRLEVNVGDGKVVTVLPDTFTVQYIVMFQRAGYGEKVTIIYQVNNQQAYCEFIMDIYVLFDNTDRRFTVAQMLTHKIGEVRRDKPYLYFLTLELLIKGLLSFSQSVGEESQILKAYEQEERSLRDE